MRRVIGRLLRPWRPHLQVLLPKRRGAPRGLGLVSGSFDPMTVAHAALADALLAEGVDLTLFVYSMRTLPKEDGPGGAIVPDLLSPAARVASLIEYCKPRNGLGVALSSHGLLAHQAEAAARRFPDTDIVLGLGSDKVIQLFDPAWYDDRDGTLDRLFSHARVLYALREGDEDGIGAVLEANPGWAPRVREIELPAGLAAVSSREVRRRAWRGVATRAEVPEEVLPFVERAASSATRFR